MIYVTHDIEEIGLLGDREMLMREHPGNIRKNAELVFTGYRRIPELTTQKFLPDPEGGDRRIYLNGDLGRMRAEGCLEHV